MMTKKANLRVILVAGFLFITLGGWLLHLSIHPLEAAPGNFIPFAAGLVSATLIPLGFMFRRTVAYAYVSNGMLVTIGTITMAHYSLQRLSVPFTLRDLFIATLLPDILLAWTAFLLGKALFELEQMKDPAEPRRQGRFLRYPNMGWWWIHGVGMSVIYALGNRLWS